MFLDNFHQQAKNFALGFHRLPSQERMPNADDILAESVHKVGTFGKIFFPERLPPDMPPLDRIKGVVITLSGGEK